MKKRISITLMSVFVLCIAPVLAFDKGGSDKVPVTFQAFNNMSTMEREVLTPLTETELASIEGAYLEVPMAAIPQMWTIYLAILEAQRGKLGCDASCVVQIVTRLAPSPNGVIFRCDARCVVQIVTRLAPSPNGANLAFVNQTPSPIGSLTTHNVSTVQQSIGGQ
jgi:hypothetical protein